MKEKVNIDLEERKEKKENDSRNHLFMDRKETDYSRLDGI